MSDAADRNWKKLNRLRKDVAWRDEQIAAQNSALSAELRRMWQRSGVKMSHLADSTGVSLSMLSLLLDGKRAWTRYTYNAFRKALR
jgi:hypothetical protein